MSQHAPPPDFANLGTDQIVAWMGQALYNVGSRLEAFKAQLDTMALESTTNAGQVALLRSEVADVTQSIQALTVGAPAAGQQAGPAIAVGTTATTSGQTGGQIQQQVPASGLPSGPGLKLAKPERFDGTDRNQSTKFEL